MLDRIRGYINDRFGSRRGMGRLAISRSLYYWGAYRVHRAIDFNRVKRLVFICHGNICRSPLGAVRATIAGCRADSYGLACRDDSMADPRAIEFSARMGMNLSSHRTRNIAHFQPGLEDLVVCMEPKHLQALAALDLKGAQVTLAGLWLKKPTPYIHDPYSSTSCYFDRCEEAIIASTDRIVSLMRAR